MASYYSNVFLFFTQIVSIVVFYEYSVKNYCLQNQILEYSLIKIKLHSKCNIKNGCCCNSDNEEDELHTQNNGIDSTNRASNLYFISNSNTPQTLPTKSCLKTNGQRSNLSVTFVERDGGHPGDENYHRSDNTQYQKSKSSYPGKNIIDENLQSTQDEYESDSSCSCCFSSKKKKGKIINPYLNYRYDGFNDYQRQKPQEPGQQSHVSSMEQLSDIPPPPSYPAPVLKTNIPHFDEAPNLHPTIKQSTVQNPQKKVANSQKGFKSSSLIINKEEITLGLRSLRRTGSRFLPPNSSIYSFENTPPEIPKKPTFNPYLNKYGLVGNSARAKSISNQSGHFETNNEPESVEKRRENQSTAIPPPPLSPPPPSSAIKSAVTNRIF